MIVLRTYISQLGSKGTEGVTNVGPNDYRLCPDSAVQKLRAGQRTLGAALRVDCAHQRLNDG